jgi:hypothetical protein
LLVHKTVEHLIEEQELEEETVAAMLAFIT